MSENSSHNKVRKDNLRHILRTAFYITIVSITTLLTGCDKKQTEQPLSIAYIYNDLAYWQTDAIKGIELFTKQNGKSFHCRNDKNIQWTVRFFKNADNPEQAVVSTRQAISQYKVDIIITPLGSGSAIPLARYAEQAKIPVIPMMATSLSLSHHKYVRTLSASDQDQLTALIRHSLLLKPNSTTLVVFDKTQKYSREMAHLFQQLASEAGYPAVSLLPIPDRDPSLADKDLVSNQRPQSTDEYFYSSLVQTKPDFIFLPLFADQLTNIGQQIRKRVPRSVFLGSDSWGLYELARNPAFSRSLVVHQWHQDFSDSIAGVNRFMMDFKQTFGRAARGQENDGYDALHLSLLAACRAKKLAPQYIGRELRHFGRFSGAQGNYLFFEDGRVRKTMALIEFRNGEAKLKEIINADI